MSALSFSWPVLFYLLLFVVAFLYASVGHGGASGYLALMSLFAMEPAFMKPTALLLNLFVSLTAFIQYYRGGHFRWKLFLPFALVSIPMSYLGGSLHLDATVYKKMLGFFLLIPALRFLFVQDAKDTDLKPSNLGLSLLIGAGLGFLSGLLGIGGGVLLSPILLLLCWSNQKQTAAVSALFIFVNSLSGLAGQLSKGIAFSPEMIVFVGIAFAGGLLGAWLGALKLKQQWLKYLLSIVLLVAAIKLLVTGA